MKEFYGKNTLKKLYYYIKNIKDFCGKKNIKKRIIKNKTVIRKGFSSQQSYYIIKRNCKAGFFSNYFFVIGHILIANENGWIPIVDMKNYKTPYNEEIEINETSNAWEYYFYQPYGIRLEDLPKKGNIYESSNDYPIGLVPSYGVAISEVPSHKMIARIEPFLPCIIESIKVEFDDEIKKNNIVGSLGVHIRGTDMKTTDAHPIPPSITSFFAAIDDYFKSTEEIPIYLCTDEKKIVDLFKKKYVNVYCSDSYRSSDGKEGIHMENKTQERELHNFYLGKEVLRDVYCLSKCKSLIAGKSNVPFAAMVMNNEAYHKTIIL